MHMEDWQFVMEKQYILFDLDGTLTDPEEGLVRSLNAGLREVGLQERSNEELRPCIGPPLRDTYEEYFGLSKEKTEQAIRGFRAYYETKGIFENRLYEGIEDVLDELQKAGKTLILATSKPTDFAVQILEHFGIDEYFDFVGGASLDETRTEKIEVLSYIMEEFQLVDASELIMVGDRKYDINAAKYFHMKSVGVLFGYGTKKELKEAGADALARSPKDLLNILLRDEDEE